MLDASGKYYLFPSDSLLNLTICRGGMFAYRVTDSGSRARKSTQKILKSCLTTGKIKINDVLKFLTSLKFTNPEKDINLKSHNKVLSNKSQIQNGVCFIDVTMGRTLTNLILLLSLNQNLLRQLS